MEVAYFTLSEKQLFVNLDRLFFFLGGGDQRPFGPLQSFFFLGGGGDWPSPSPCSYAYASPPEPLVQINNYFTEIFLVMASTKTVQRVHSPEQNGCKS